MITLFIARRKGDSQASLGPREGEAKHGALVAVHTITPRDIDDMMHLSDAMRMILGERYYIHIVSTAHSPACPPLNRLFSRRRMTNQRDFIICLSSLIYIYLIDDFAIY